MRPLKRLYARWLSLGQVTLQRRIDLASNAITMLEAARMDPNEWKFHRSELRQRYRRMQTKIDRLRGDTA
jgi:hypothetical protein